MSKICKKCGRLIKMDEYIYNGVCENCHKGINNQSKHAQEEMNKVSDYFMAQGL